MKTLERVYEVFYCPKCLAMFEEECVCDNDEIEDGDAWSGGFADNH